MDVREQLRQFVIENFLFGRQNGLKDDASFLDNSIIDSTGVLELIQFVEETFGIKVQDQDLVPENLDSIDRVTNFVQRQLNANGGAA